MKEPTRKEWTCYELTHCGEGGRGQKVVTNTSYYVSPQEAAELAAEHFDEEEKAKERCGDDSFDGGFRYIEVVDDAGNAAGRFEVLCRVERKYSADRMKENP